MVSSGDEMDMGGIMSADEVDESMIPQEKKMKLKMGTPLLKTSVVGGKTPRSRPSKQPLPVTILADKSKKVEYYK